MVLVFEDIGKYSEKAYKHHLLTIPSWRREYAMKYKSDTERKKSVLAYILLTKAAELKFGKQNDFTFSYNEFGKPHLSDNRFFFSISHSKNAVACAVYENETGLDIQNLSGYNEKIAKRMFPEAVFGEENKDEKFTALWTEKEAISKFIGKGIQCPFSNIKKEDFLLVTDRKEELYLSLCYGRKGEILKTPQILYIDKSTL